MAENSHEPLLNSNILATSSPPIIHVRSWLDTVKTDQENCLLDLSQAMPIDPPHEAIQCEMSKLVLDEPSMHHYGPVLGMSELREKIAERTNEIYKADIQYENVAVTSGCNQAFTAAIAALVNPGDAVIIVSPWYFNHKMWLEMMGIETKVLQCGNSLVPDPEAVANLISSQVRAMVLVTPNNPTGLEYPKEVMRAIFELAHDHGITLIVDETYRDFISCHDSLHDLFCDSQWEQSLVHLYSFSKSFRLAGHRIGAMVASSKIIKQVEKYLDTVAICASQIGQRAALLGLQELGPWLDEQRQIILARAAAVKVGFQDHPNWKLRGCGAYFALVEHRFEMTSEELAKQMLAEVGVLALPGTMFARSIKQGGNGDAEKWLRLAFANISEKEICEFFHRIEEYCPKAI